METSLRDNFADQPDNAGSHAHLLTACCGIAFLCYLGSYMRLPVVPLYAKTLGADAVMVGLINSAFFLVAAFLSFPLGMISDRVGRKLLASTGLVILSGSSFLLCLCKTPVQIMSVYFLFGAGLAAFGPTMMSFVADMSLPSHLGRSYGWYTTVLYGAMSLGPAAGGALAQHLGFQTVFMASGVCIFITFWLLRFLIPSPRRIRSAVSPRNLFSGVKECFGNRRLVACWGATIGGCFGLGMFITFLPLDAQEHGLSIGKIGLVFCVQGIANALSRIPFGHLSDRVARRENLITVGTVGFAVAMVGFGLSSGLPGFLFFGAALGISMGISFTSIGALMAEVVPPWARGLAMGGYNTGIYLGMMLSSACMGSVIHAIGFEWAFFVTALVNLAIALVFHVIARAPLSGAPSMPLSSGPLP